MKNNRITRMVGGAIALMVIATGCSSTRSGSDGTSGSGGTDSAAVSGNETFGTLKSPCGKGSAKGATDQGITDKQITIGYGDDRGFAQAPGLSKEMGDAVSTMIDWCNEQGGINGRQIKGNQYDAAYTQSVSVMQKSCKQDFMLVGQGFAMDEAAEQFRVGCNLPTVAGFTVGANASMGPMKFEATPYPVDYYNSSPLAQAAKLFPDFKNKMDILLSTSPAITAGTNKIADALKTIGVTPMKCGVKFNQAGDASYVHFAEKIKACGAKALWNTSSPKPGDFSMLESMDRVGIHPTLVYEATWYSSAVSAWNTKGAGDNLHVGLAFQPFENAAQVPAVAKYLDLVKAKGGKTALLGMQATSSFLLWAQAAQACGSDLSRQCMVNKLSQVHDWTGGGLHAPTDPGGNKPSGCSLMLKLTGDKYEQIAPKTVGEFDCDPANVIKTDPAAWGIKLNADRTATTFLTANVIKPKV